MVWLPQAAATYITFTLGHYLLNISWPCLLTLTSGGNKGHRIAIDTDSVAIRATKQLLTPTSVPGFLSI